MKMQAKSRPSAVLLWPMLGALLLLTACPAQIQKPSFGPPVFGPDLNRAQGPKSPGAAWKAWIGGDSAGAMAQFESLAQAEPPDPLALFGLAESQLYRARFTTAVESHADFLRRYPEHPLSRWSAQRIHQLRHQSARWPETVAALADDLSGKPADPAARAWLGMAELEARYTLFRTSGAAAVFDGAPQGFAQSWRLAGPFSAHPFLDARAVLPVDADGTLKPAYTVNGFERPTQTVLFDEPFGDPPLSLTGVYVLETWMSVESDFEAIAQLQTGADAQVWINDQLVFDRDLSKGYPRERYGIPMRFSEGIVRVRVRLVVDRGDEKFSLVFTPRNGGKAPLRFFAEIPAGSQSMIEPQGETPALDFLGGLGASDVNGHCLLQWLRAVGAVAERDVTAARGSIDAMDKTCPAFGPGLLARGDLAQSNSSIADITREERALAAWRALLESDPEAGIVADKMAMVLFYQQQEDTALALLEGAILDAPDEWFLFWHRYQLLKDRGWDIRAEKALDKALALDPNRCSLIAAQWNDWSFQDRWPSPDDLPKGFMGCDITLENLAQNHDAVRGDLKAAIARTEALVARNPRSVNQVLSLATLYHRAGQSKLADETFSKAEKLTTNTPEVQARHLDVMLARNNKNAPDAALSQWLAKNPGSYTLLRAKGLLNGKNALEDLRVDGKTVIDDYLKDPKHTDTSAVYLLDYAAVRIFPDGSNLSITHIIVRVGNKEGIDDYGEIEIPASALLLNIRTVKPDGRVMEPDFVPGKDSISMPNLAEGDFVEYEYLEGGSGSVSRKGAYYGIRFFFNIFGSPLLRSEYIIETPTDWSEPVIETRNGGPKPETTTVDGRLRHRFIVKDAPRARSEPEAPASVETIPSILLTHRYGWADGWRDYRDRVLSVARPNDELLAETQALANKHKTDKERLRAAFYRVGELIDDDGSGVFAQTAAHTFSAGLGDRLVVLKTMLDIMGIDNAIVLGRTWGQDQNVGEFPVMDNWGFTVLRAEADGEIFWLDPTLNHAIFGYIAPGIQGNLGITTAALASPGKEELLVEIPALGPDNFLRAVTIEGVLSETGNLEGQVLESFSGSSATQMRRVLDDFTDLDEFQDQLAQVLAASFPGAAIEGLAIGNRDNPEAPLELRYTLKSTGFARIDGNQMMVDQKLFSSEIATGYASLAASERRLPVAILSPSRMDLVVNLRLPPGHKGEVLYDPAPKETDFGSLKVTSDNSSGGQSDKISFRRSLNLPIQRVEPQKYEAFRNFALTVDEGETFRLKIARP